jgi:hypothetical protein
MRARIAPAALAVPLAAFALAGPSIAQPSNTQSTQTEADWIAYDAAKGTVTVKVVDAGRGKEAKRLKKNQEVTFAVRAEGTVLTRTTVSINGMKAELGDLPPGKRVNVYWRAQEDGTLFARKIDAIMSEEEFDAKYGTGEEAH